MKADGQILFVCRRCGNRAIPGVQPCRGRACPARGLPVNAAIPYSARAGHVRPLLCGGAEAYVLPHETGVDHVRPYIFCCGSPIAIYNIICYIIYNPIHHTPGKGTLWPSTPRRGCWMPLCWLIVGREETGTYGYKITQESPHGTGPVGIHAVPGAAPPAKRTAA